MSWRALNIWIVRFALLLTALMAPGLTFWFRSARTGNAEQAIDGVWPGFVITIILLAGFSLTFRTTPTGRLGYVGLATAIVVLGWLGLTVLPIFGPH